MITPAYSPTATERVLPRLALDFTTGVLDSRVTVTRALNTATRINSSGYIEAVNANLPRFDYDPVTLLPRGLLIEETRANFVLQSNTLNAGSGTSVTSAAATSPDGTTNAYRVAKTDATTPRYTTNDTSMTVAANTTYTVSRFVKYDGFNTTVSLEYNSTVNWDLAWNAQFTVASTGVTVSSTSGCTATAPDFGGGWYRITATFTTGASITSPTNPTILMRITGASGVSVLGYGAQLELGAFPTSYIPTTTTSLTRNADAVSMTGTNFSDWFNATEGTLVVDASTFKPTTSAASAVVAEVNDGTLANRNALQYQSSDANARTVASGSIVVNITRAYTANVVNRLVYAFKTNSFAFAQNGTLAGSSVSGTNPTVDRLMIGSFSANTAPLNGHVSALRFYNIRLLNAETTAFSKG